MSKKDKIARRNQECALAHPEIHFIDIENMLGTARYTLRDVERFRAFYLKVNKVHPKAHIVIGASSGEAMLIAGIAWPDARTAFIRGKDGADRVLIQTALGEHVEDRYEKAFFASGDHEFIDAVQTLQTSGMHVTVFARATRLSKALWAACKHVKTFSAKEFALAA